MRILLCFLVSFILLSCSTVGNRQTTLVLDYKEFGPQIIASEVVGMEWWQWQDHGASRPTNYPIKVVVYRNIALETVKNQYPVAQQQEKDFRYIEYASAMTYLDEKIKEDIMSDVTLVLKKTRLKLIDAFER